MTSDTMDVAQHPCPLLCTGASAKVSLIGPCASSEDLLACYKFAAWLMEHPGSATGEPCSLEYQVGKH